MYCFIFSSDSDTAATCVHVQHRWWSCMLPTKICRACRLQQHNMTCTPQIDQPLHSLQSAAEAALPAGARTHKFIIIRSVISWSCHVRSQVDLWPYRRSSHDRNLWRGRFIPRLQLRAVDHPRFLGCIKTFWQTESAEAIKG